MEIERRPYKDVQAPVEPKKKRGKGRPPGIPNPRGGRKKGPEALAKLAIQSLAAECKSWMADPVRNIVDAITLEESRLAFSDIRLIPGCPQGIPDDIAYAISSFEVKEDVMKTLDGGEQIIRREAKFKLWPKGQALERLSRQLGLYEQDNKQKGDIPNRPVVNLYIENGDVNMLTSPQLTIDTDRANGHSIDIDE